VREFGNNTGNDWAVASAAYNIALALLDLEDVDGAFAAVSEGLERAKMAGHPPLIFFNRLVWGMVERAQGQVSVATATHLEALAFIKTIDNPFMRLLIASELCVDYVYARRWQQACAYALEARVLRQQIPYAGFSQGIEIEALLHEGYTDEAKVDVQLLRDEVQRRPDNLRLPKMLLYAEGLFSGEPLAKG
jgi:hypothetical protein